jgi:ABC-type phosphate transport system substrate-binding protein
MPVTPVLLKQGPVQDEFLSLYIGKSDSGFRAGWRSILFSGQGMMPKTLDSEAAVVEYVSHTPGAIGYIGRSTPHEGAKILTVR